MANEELLTQAEFAREISVHRSAINHYRKNGKLSDAAFRQVGTKALVVVDVAKRELGLNLDMVQSAVNGRAELAPQPGPAEPAAAPVPRDDTKSQYEAARLKKINLENEEAERRRRERAGIYVRSDDARQAVGSALARLFQTMESDLAVYAEELAAVIDGADGRVIEVKLRELFRATRGKFSDLSAELRDAFPEVREDGAEDGEEPADMPTGLGAVAAE